MNISDYQEWSQQIRAWLDADHAIQRATVEGKSHVFSVTLRMERLQEAWDAIQRIGCVAQVGKRYLFRGLPMQSILIGTDDPATAAYIQAIWHWPIISGPDQTA
jgi:hypothetical protein